MAIKILGTTVIDDSRNFTVAGINGTYDNLQPNLTTITTVISFNSPAMNRVMTGSQSFSIANDSRGATCSLLLDTTTSNHTPIFPASLFWAGDATPVWSNARYWLITFIGWGGGNVHAAATGYD